MSRGSVSRRISDNRSRSERRLSTDFLFPSSMLAGVCVDGSGSIRKYGTPGEFGRSAAGRRCHVAHYRNYSDVIGLLLR